MGYEIYAYFDIDQNQIEEFIQKNNIDRNNWEQTRRVAEFYKEQHPELKNIWISYDWDKKCPIHKIYSSQKTNFIRDDARMNDRCYNKILEKKYNRPFPECLTNINWYLNNAKDAIEIADELANFFADDEELMYFADWLRITAKYCDIYELSY